MALNFVKYDIKLGVLDEGTSKKRTLPGSLAVCTNGQFSKGGAVDKRHGYSLVQVQTEPDGTPIDPHNLFANVAMAHGELLVEGHNDLYALADREGNVGDGALVKRGPTVRGNGEMLHITSAELSD